MPSYFINSVKAVTSSAGTVKCFKDNDQLVPCEEGGFAPLSELTGVFANLAGVVLTLAGFAVILMLIIGGFRYITARGDPKALAAARSTLTWTIVGLIFIILAFLIVDFIAGFVQIPAIGEFCLPAPGAECPYELTP